MNAVKSPSLIDAQLMRETLLSERLGATILAVVNLASRIEQLNKEFNTQLLISETVWHAVRGQGTHAASLGKVPIRGREEAVEIFALAT
jgi:class 3 adenylate cyclase